jgi:peptide/nickel transport system ATP-binding protein
MSEPILTVEDLHVHFATYAGTVHAVNGISFEILKGEIFGLVGETGCGKTVTGLSLLRLVPPPGRIYATRILCGGTDLLAASDAEMDRIRGRRIAMIFQDPTASLNPVFRISDQIVRPICHHKQVGKKAAWSEATAMLEAVGLPEPAQIMEMYPHELSGGMQQRVMIAMALSLGAELLIADEPTTALDVTIQAQILELMVKLTKSYGLAILLITHNLGVVAETCDRVGVLYAGTLAEMGPTVEIFRGMKHPYTQALLAAIPRESSHGKRLSTIPGSVPSGLDHLESCAFHPRCPAVMETCKQVKPPLLPVGDHWCVACHLYPGTTQPEVHP